MEPLKYQDVWTALKNDDDAAFSQLYERYWEMLFQYSYRMLQNTEDAKEVIQNLFIHLWNKRKSLPEVQSPEAYLKTAVRNRTLNQLQQRNYYAGFLATLPADEAVNFTEEFLNKKDNRQYLANRLNELPARMREVVSLHLFQHLSIREIASVTGTAEQTVRNQINDAIKKLRKSSAILFLLFPPF